MADQKRNHPSMPPDLQGYFVDNGDGTFSPKVSASVAVSATNMQTAAKGTTAQLNPTSTDVDANRSALDVYIRGGAGGGGGPATIADGADVAQGTTTDASTATTTIGLLKAIKAAVTGTVAVSGTFWQITQPVSIAATVNVQDAADLAGGSAVTLASQTTTMIGARNAAGNSTAIAAMADNADAVAASGTGNDLRIGALGYGFNGTTWDRLRVNSSKALTVDGSAVTQPVSIAATVNVNPSGETAGVGVGAAADTSASNSVIGRLKALIALFPASVGQKAMAASFPVVLASDQTSIPVASTLSAETTKVIGTVNQGTSPWLVNPSGETAGVGVGAAADTSASNSVIGRLKALIALFPTALGQGTMATSMKVVLPSDQTSIPVAATLAAETTKVIGTVNQGTSPWVGNTTQLAGTAIDVNSGAKSAGTQRVVLATDQPALTNALKVDGSAVVQPIKGDSPAAATVTASSATANGQITSLTVTGYGSAIITAIGDAGTQTTPEIVKWEGSTDGANWFPLLAQRLDVNVAPALNLTTAVSTQRMFQLNVAGLTTIRLNQTQQIVGTGTVAWRMVAVAQDSEPTVQTLVADGQNVALGTSTDAANANSVIGQLKQTNSVVTTKSTQPTTNYLGTQDAHNAGRNPVTLYTDDAVTTAVAETILTTNQAIGFAAITTGTSRTVTAGKKFRVQALEVSASAAGTTPTAARVTITVRVNTGGAALVSSPQVLTAVCSLAATAGASDHSTITIPEGLEIPAAAGVALTVATLGWVSGTVTPRFSVRLVGYEY